MLLAVSDDNQLARIVDHTDDTTAINSFTDLFLTILPAVIISFSSLSRKSRLGLVFLLCLSCVYVLASHVTVTDH